MAMAAVSLSCCSVVRGAADWDGAKVTKTALDAGETKHGKFIYSFEAVITRSGCHVVRVEGERWREVFARRDGKRGKAYEDISTPVFSPDGTALGYTAQGPDGACVVINDQEGPVFDEILPETFVFSHDGRRHAYLISMAGRLVAVVDGVVQPAVDGDMQPWRQPPVFSADGSSVGYVVWSRLRQKMRVVVNGKSGESFDGWYPESLRFSPDGHRFSYAANDLGNGDQWFCVIDGERKKAFDHLGVSYAFSPDGKRFAYTGDRGPQWFLVVDGKSEVPIEGIVNHSVIFSPDSRRLAYAVAKPDKRAYLVVDGKAGPVHDRILGPPPPVIAENRTSTQSGSGLEPGPSIRRPQVWLNTAFAANSRPALETGPSVLSNYNVLRGSFLLFSPDSRRIAYIARVGKSGVVYVDGKTDGIEIDHIVGGMLFSDDSKRLAYGGQRENKQFLVVDGKKGADYEAIGGSFDFSPDGKHIAHVAVQGGKQIIVVDGRERGKYHTVPAGPVFRSDGVLEFLVADGTTLYRMEIRDF